MKEKNITLWDQKVFYKHFDAIESKWDILILHWWWGKSDSWKSVAEILYQNQYSVYVPDLPGFWKTPIEKVYTLELYAELIENFLGQLWLEPVLLLWHSNGGAISATVASRCNRKVKKLILNNSAWVRANMKRRVKRYVMKPFVFVFKCFSFLPFYEKLRRIIYSIIWWGDYVNAEKENLFLKSTYLNMIGNDITKTFHNIKLPTHLIWGKTDTFTPLSDASYIRFNIKDSTMEVIEGQWHSIHLSSPIVLAKHILDYLND